MACRQVLRWRWYWIIPMLCAKQPLSCLSSINSIYLAWWKSWRFWYFLFESGLLRNLFLHRIPKTSTTDAEIKLAHQRITILFFTLFVPLSRQTSNYFSTFWIDSQLFDRLGFGYSDEPSLLLRGSLRGLLSCSTRERKNRRVVGHTRGTFL